MATVFHAWACGKFIEIPSNLWRKKLYRMNQSPNIFRCTFSSRDNVRVPIQFRRESQPQHLKRWFFSQEQIHLSSHYLHSNVIGPANKTSWVFPELKLTSHILPQFTVSCRSDSSSEANSSCYHRADAWSHLELRVVPSA